MTAPPVEPSAVLVVDDDKPIHLVYQHVVERAGGQAFMVENGQEAVKKLEERDFAAALLDKNLPDMSGVEVLKLIKQRQPRTEVIMVTGYAGLESAVQALRLGAYDYVEKPFDIAVLGDRLKEAIARRRRLAADVAQDVEGPLLRLGSELEVVANVLRVAVSRVRAAVMVEETTAPLGEIEQVVSSIGEAAESARQIALALSRTGKL